MRILFLSDNFPPEVNAAATRVYERACHWVEEGHEVTILTSAPNFPLGKVFEGYENAWHQVEIKDGIRVVRVKTFMTSNAGFALRILDFLSYMVMAILTGLFEKKPDVVMATSPQFFTAIAGWFLSFVKRRPFILEISDLWPESIKGVGAMKSSFLFDMLEKIELFLYRQARVIIVLTQAFKDNMIYRGIDPKKIEVVRNGVDLTRYAPRPKDATLVAQYALEGRIVVGYIGTHGMAHGLENVVATAALCQADQLPYTFLFVGEGAEKEKLLQEAKRLDLKNVLFIPLQKKEDMPRWWSLCDVALVHLKKDPAFSKVIPSKIFEAMGMGLPILLVAPSGEASQIILADKCGAHIEPADPEELKFILETRFRREDLPAFCHLSQEAAPRYDRRYQSACILKIMEETIGQRD